MCPSALSKDKEEALGDQVCAPIHACYVLSSPPSRRFLSVARASGLRGRVKKTKARMT